MLCREDYSWARRLTRETFLHVRYPPAERLAKPVKVQKIPCPSKLSHATFVQKGNTCKSPSHPPKFSCSYTYGPYFAHLQIEFFTLALKNLILIFSAYLPILRSLATLDQQVVSVRQISKRVVRYIMYLLKKKKMLYFQSGTWHNFLSYSVFILQNVIFWKI